MGCSEGGRFRVTVQESKTETRHPYRNITIIRAIAFIQTSIHTRWIYDIRRYYDCQVNESIRGASGR